MPTTGTFHAITEHTPHSCNDHQKREPVCVFCKGNHKPLKCTKVVDPKERLAIVRRKNLCFNYLAKHKATQCHSKFTYRKCKKQHHTSLCHAFAVADVATPPASTSLQPTNTSLQPANTSTETSMTAVTPLSAYNTSVCLLKTAITVVSSGSFTTKGNILFDEEPSDPLLLRNWLIVCTFSQPTARQYQFHHVSTPNSLEVATLFVHTLSGSRIQISVLIVPKLAAPIRNLPEGHTLP